MQLSEFFTRYTLHDSVLRRIVATADQLWLLVELCNYDQPTFSADQPEMITGWFVFEQVRTLQSEPPLSDISWGKDVDGEVVRVEKIAGGAKVVAKTENEATNTEGVLILRFVTDSVTWRELSRSQLPDLERGFLPSPAESFARWPTRRGRGDVSARLARAPAGP